MGFIALVTTNNVFPLIEVNLYIFGWKLDSCGVIIALCGTVATDYVLELWSEMNKTLL